MKVNSDSLVRVVLPRFFFFKKNVWASSYLVFFSYLERRGVGSADVENKRRVQHPLGVVRRAKHTESQNEIYTLELGEIKKRFQSHTPVPWPKEHTLAITLTFHIR